MKDLEENRLSSKSGATFARSEQRVDPSHRSIQIYLSQKQQPREKRGFSKETREIKKEWGKFGCILRSIYIIKEPASGFPRMPQNERRFTTSSPWASSNPWAARCPDPAFHKQLSAVAVLQIGACPRTRRYEHPYVTGKSEMHERFMR
jgi:hypothetical protein